jgi:hypothetical protein
MNVAGVPGTFSKPPEKRSGSETVAPLRWGLRHST